LKIKLVKELMGGIKRGKRGRGEEGKRGKGLAADNKIFFSFPLPLFPFLPFPPINNLSP
jgi:hypothetical protein